MKVYIKISILFIITIVICLLIPSNNSEYKKNGKLYINEINTNKYIIDDDNEYSDYIELYNGYSYDINLSGYYISDDEYNTNKYKIESGIIKAKSYLLIYASGKNRVSGDYIHTNFKLSSNGEVVTLTDKDNNIISKVKYSKIDSNKSYGYYKNKYVMMIPSPGLVNTEEVKNKDSVNIKDKVIINEYMTHNKSSNYDSNGYYTDWIELYNTTLEDIDLSGIYISNNKSNLSKYSLEGIIKAESYLVIYFNKDINGYVNFNLSDDDEIILSDGENIYIGIKLVKLMDNISYGLKEDKWYYFTSPTPGYENNTAGFIEMGDSNGSS